MSISGREFVTHWCALFKAFVHAPNELRCIVCAGSSGKADKARTQLGARLDRALRCALDFSHAQGVDSVNLDLDSQYFVISSSEAVLRVSLQAERLGARGHSEHEKI